MKTTDPLALFPTLVMRTNSFLDKSQCEEVFKFVKNVKMESHGALRGGGVSSHRGDKEDVILAISNNIKSCMNIRYEILDALNKYSSTSGIVYTEVTNSWVNIQDVGSTLLPHTHPIASLSGALYIKIDEHSSKLNFHNPNPFATFTNNNSVGSDYMYNTYWVEAKSGDLLIFPSWLQHSSHAVNKTPDRTVISLNAR